MWGGAPGLGTSPSVESDRPSPRSHQLGHRGGERRDRSGRGRNGIDTDEGEHVHRLEHRSRSRGWVRHAWSKTTWAGPVIGVARRLGRTVAARVQGRRAGQTGDDDGERKGKNPAVPRAHDRTTYRRRVTIPGRNVSKS